MSEGYFNEKPGRALRSWALYQMLAGAGWGAAFTLAIAAFLLALWGVSLLLPEESKQAPAPYSYLIDAPLTVAAA